MNRCLYLAKKGLGTTFPNPMVGCVIVHKDKVIGEGWHRRSGESHAEVKAINSVVNKDLLLSSTLYVSLEPCSHHGKTPPCSDLIIEHKIPEVVIASADDFEEVNGKGIAKLKKAGINVHLGIMQREARELNKRFFTFHQRKRPYVILKWAQTADGFIATMNQRTGEALKISDMFSHQIAHKWRAEEQAILVGKNTALKDKPSLTTRKWKGSSPIKLIIDPNLDIPENDKLFKDNGTSLVFADKRSSKVRDTANVYYIDLERNIIPQIMEVCHNKNIQSILVEGGAETHQSFIDDGTWDEARTFTSDKLLHEGIRSAEKKGKMLYSKQLHQDRLEIFQNDQNPII